MVVKVEHLPVVVCPPSPLERLDDFEEHLETSSHRKVIPKIFRCQKSTATELLGFPEIGLDQAAGGVCALHHSAPLLGQGAQTIQLVEEIAGPVVRPTTAPLPDESGGQGIFLRPELVMEMRDEQSTFGRFFGRFGSGHFPSVGPPFRSPLGVLKKYSGCSRKTSAPAKARIEGVYPITFGNGR